MNCLEKLALPNYQVNYNLISINLFKTIYVEIGYCKEKLSNILESKVDTSGGGRKVCGGV